MMIMDEERNTVREDQRARFYFTRAWATTWGILLAWTLWVLLPAIVVVILLSVAGGIGSLLPDEGILPSGEPGFTSEPTWEPEPGVQNTCGPLQDEPC
jgi:hypothetical protein